MNCDDCKHYEWYYDRCRKWNCEVDAREVHNCFEQRETPVRDAMANSGQMKAVIVVNGNCVVCGKQLNCGRLFVCKECESKWPKKEDVL